MPVATLIASALFMQTPMVRVTVVPDPKLGKGFGAISVTLPADMVHYTKKPVEAGATYEDGYFTGGEPGGGYFPRAGNTAFVIWHALSSPNNDSLIREYREGAKDAEAKPIKVAGFDGVLRMRTMIDGAGLRAYHSALLWNRRSNKWIRAVMGVRGPVGYEADGKLFTTIVRSIEIP